MKQLQAVQSALKAPKGQYNSFSKFNYRSCEDILEALKPLLAEHGACLTLSDKVNHVGDRFYVEATATFTVGENSVSVTASAREEVDKKGMSEAQITGATSSYARKYALNGLFAIDDTKDADTQGNREKPPTANVEHVGKDLELPTATVEKIVELAKKAKITQGQMKKKIESLKSGKTKIEELNVAEAATIIAALEQKAGS